MVGTCKLGLKPKIEENNRNDPSWGTEKLTNFVSSCGEASLQNWSS